MMERGVSVVIFAVMITMVILMLFSVWYVYYVHSSTKRAEFEHIQTVGEDFRYLQFLVSNLKENSLATAEFRMSPAPLVGAPSPARASIFWVENENLPGSVCLKLGGTYSSGYTYIYEGGAVLIQQGSKVSMKFEPRAFTLENDNLVYTEVRLKDSVPEVAGTGRISLTLFLENVVEERRKENIYVWSHFPGAWERYLKWAKDNLILPLYPSASLTPLENGWCLSLGEENMYTHRVLVLSVRMVC
jgi:hypothetical protein